MNLDWNFFYDSWLIDIIPETLPLTIIESDEGWNISPKELTFYFGANPHYLYGEGKLYHEIIYANGGLFPMPFVFGRPGLEFVSSISVGLDSTTDWLGDLIGTDMVGRIKISEFIQKYTAKYYGITSDTPSTVGGVSSQLDKITESNKDNMFDVSYEVVYKSKDEFVNAFNPTMYLPMYVVDNKVREYISGDKLEVITPFEVIYTKKGILKPTLNLKNSKLDITKYVSKAFENSTDQMCIFFKTNEFFLGGVVFDYSATLLDGRENRGFRLYLDRLGLKIVSNTGEKTPNTYTMPIDIDFKTPRAFIINIYFNSHIDIYISGDELKRFNFRIKKPIFKEDDRCILSGIALDKSYVQTGNFEEIGVASKIMDEGTLNRFIQFDPLLNIADLPAPTGDKPTPVINGLMYSKQKVIHIPRGVEANESINGYTVSNINNRIDIAKKIYAADNNKNIRETYMYSVDNKTASTPLNKDKSKLGYSEFVLNPGEYVFGAYGFPELSFDDKTEYFKMIKKLTSDIHVPLKVTIKFKIPKWYTKDVRTNMEIRLASVDELIWYSYKKYKTGEWL